MNTDWIENTLREADAAAGPARLAPGLALRAVPVARQRAHRRVMLTSGVAATVLLAGMMLPWLPSLRGSDTAPVAVARGDTEPVAPGELARMGSPEDTAARSHRAVAHKIAKLLERENTTGSRSKAKPGSLARSEYLASQEVQSQLDRAAETLVFQADHLHRVLKKRHAALERYQRVIRLFPNTPWAVVARQKLDELHQQSRTGEESCIAPPC